MSAAENAYRFKLKQAEELLKLFEEDTGAPARSMEELEAWGASARGEFAIRTKGNLLKKLTGFWNRIISPIQAFGFLTKPK
jgi:hypothetical protein